MIMLTNVEDMSAPPENAWIVAWEESAKAVLTMSSGSFVGLPVKIDYISPRKVKREKWTIKKLAYELLPDRLLSALSAAANTARNALTAANAAQSTANAAQSTADAAQSILGDVSTGKVQAEILLTFDKQTSGRDSFVFNGFSYYKFSEFSPAPADVIGFSGTRENGKAYSDIAAGKNCCRYGLFVVVTKAGECSLPITSTVSGSFTAPSTGLYAMCKDNNTVMTAGDAEFTYMRANLLVISPTGKKFKIAVDDTGTLSATEVTDTTT